MQECNSERSAVGLYAGFIMRMCFMWGVNAPFFCTKICSLPRMRKNSTARRAVLILTFYTMENLFLHKCPHCGETIWKLAYFSGWQLKCSIIGHTFYLSGDQYTLLINHVEAARFSSRFTIPEEIAHALAITVNPL